MKLTEEGVAWLQRSERLTARSPDVDIVGLLVRQLAEPTPVGDADEGLHEQSSMVVILRESGAFAAMADRGTAQALTEVVQ